MVHQLRAHGIEQDIAEDGEQVVVLLNGKTLEPALPDMAVTAVVPMVATDVTGHPPLHERTESVIGSRRYHEMKMVGHQAEAKNLNRISGFRRAEQVEEGGIVGVLMKDGHAAVATVQDVIGVTSAGAARNARHEALTIEEESSEGK